VNDAIPNSPAIEEINIIYKDIAIDITSISIDAGIPTFKISLAMLESNLNSPKLTSTYVSFLTKIQYNITIAEQMELKIVAIAAPADPHPKM